MRLSWTELLREAAEAGAGAGGEPAQAGGNAPPPAPGAEPPAKAPEPSAGAGNAAPSGEGADKDKPAPQSIYDDLGVDEPGKEGSSTWPADWRVQMAGGDEKLAKQLERFTTPDALAKSFAAAQQKLRSGEYKRGLPENASEEEVKAWRQEQGIPADPKDYDLPTLLDGNYDDLDDFGKETVDQFKQTFHELNLKPDDASRIMKVANEVAEKQLERQAQADAQAMEALEDTLRSEWGAEFRGNRNLNAKFMQDKFGDDWQKIILARTPDGQRLADSPVFNKFINQMARLDGGAVLESGESVAGTNAEARIAEIEKIMATDLGRYKREGLAAEYGKLLAARR